MPAIETKKELVAILNDPQPSNIGFGVEPGCVKQVVKNEGVTHEIALNPDEAINIGVVLIQLAAQSRALAQQVQVQQNANVRHLNGLKKP